MKRDATLNSIKLYFHLIIVVVFLIAASVTTEPAQAKKGCCRSKHGESAVSVPLLFATDRMQIPAKKTDLDFGKQVINPIDSIQYGVVRVDTTCTLPKSPELDVLQRSGWIVYPAESDTRKKRAEFLGQQSVTEQSRLLGDGIEGMFSKMRSFLQESNKKEFVVYVHGCCLDFNGSMQQAADLASSVRAPLIAYSWGCSKGYGGSNLAYPRTQERFNNFMVALLKAFPEERICLVSNSIGSELAINFCLQRRAEDFGGRKINQLILSRADVDHVAFKSQLQHVNDVADKIIMYVAKNDFQINLSGTLHWFFYPSQHGERAGHLRAELQSEPSLTVLDVSPLRMGHVIPYESVADIFENNGAVPRDTRLYHYAHMADNLYRVTPHRSGLKQAAADSTR